MNHTFIIILGLILSILFGSWYFVIPRLSYYEFKKLNYNKQLLNDFTARLVNRSKHIEVELSIEMPDELSLNFTPSVRIFTQGKLANYATLPSISGSFSEVANMVLGLMKQYIASNRKAYYETMRFMVKHSRKFV